jgi:hypothetical protein
MYWFEGERECWMKPFQSWGLRYSLVIHLIVEVREVQLAIVLHHLCHLWQVTQTTAEHLHLVRVNVAER